MYFANSVAPYILYACSLLLVLLGFNRFRLGSPVKGVLNFIGAATIAIIAWGFQSP